METKYLTIYNEIINKIENKEYKPDTKLPSENEMMQIYDVSRATIRKALGLLENNGFIQKVKGKGSIVLDINKFDFPVSGIVTFKELSKKIGRNAKTIVKELEVVKPNEFLIENLNVSKVDEVWKVTRIREIGSKKIILDKDFFNKNYIPSLTKEICEDSIYEYIENNLGLSISFAKKEITVQPVTEEDKECLDLEGYDMVVVVRSFTFLEDTSLFQYTESRHRPDKFKFVDFARRDH